MDEQERNLAIAREGFEDYRRERFELEAKDFDPVGEHTVLATIMQRGVGKGSGVEVEMRAYYMLEYRDGMATRVHLYPDREQALEAARAGEERAVEDS